MGSQSSLSRHFLRRIGQTPHLSHFKHIYLHFASALDGTIAFRTFVHTQLQANKSSSDAIHATSLRASSLLDLESSEDCFDYLSFVPINRAGSSTSSTKWPLTPILNRWQTMPEVCLEPALAYLLPFPHMPCCSITSWF